MERHQGDLNDISSQPHLRYIGGDGQYAEGVFNPFKVYGYMNPANAKFASLTGTIAAGINSIHYDHADDIIYLSEEGENILQLDGMDDTSVANYLTVTSGSTIKDMIIYEVNNEKAIIYAVDTNGESGSSIGFKTIDSSKGVETFAVDLVGFTTSQLNELSIQDGATNPASSFGRIVAQSFDSDDLASLIVTGAQISVRRKGGTGSGITLRLSIQATEDPNSGIYTSQGAWATSTSYSVNDTVTNSGTTYACWSAHTSASNTEPGTGALWESVWVEFGAPDGTALASQTFSGTDITTVGVEDEEYQDFAVAFSSSVTLTAGTKYWLVLDEVGTNMGASDDFAWKGTAAGTEGYADQWSVQYMSDATTPFWSPYFPDFAGNVYTDLEFSLILNNSEVWSRELANGFFTTTTGEESFLFLSENALVYWFYGSNVHTIDGGLTGGLSGRVNENILQFPSYIQPIDAAETHSRS